MTLLVGTSGYSYKEWKGSFYPADLAAKKMLSFYAGNFRTVEINSSFRRLPEASVLKGWAAEVGEDFRFVLKAPQLITHYRRLKRSAIPVRQLLKRGALLGPRFGAILFQLPPQLKKNAPVLREFLKRLTPEIRCAIEFRHETWFDDEVYELLRGKNVALCIADSEESVAVPPVATADWGYLRLRRPDYSGKDLARWAKLVARQSWRDTFVFFKHEDEGKGPALAKQFLRAAQPRGKSA